MNGQSEAVCTCPAEFDPAIKISEKLPFDET